EVGHHCVASPGIILRHGDNPSGGPKAQRPPVESDRIRQVLSAIFDSGELRIKDVTSTVSVPHQSINALMQYLKRKRLVKKSGRELHSPYALTAEGIAILVEMTRNSGGQGEAAGRT